MDLRSYISKLNDRNLQRKRESGFTTYALYSIFLLILYKIVELYPYIPFKTNLWSIIYFSTFCFNIYFFVVVILSVFQQTLGNNSSVMIIFNEAEDESLFEICVTLSIFLIPTISNISIIVFLYFFSNDYSIYHILISLLFLFILWIIVATFPKNNSNLETYEPKSSKENTDKNIFFIIIYTISIIIIVYSFYCLFTEFSTFSKLNILIFSGLVYSIPLIIFKIIDLIKSDNFTKDLENLEYEINMKNLDDKDIRERLQKNYMGFFLIGWVTYLKEDFERFKEIINKKQEEINKQIEEVRNIDKNMTFEIQGRQKTIDSKKIELSKEVERKLTPYLQTINKIFQEEYKSLDNTERIELSRLYHSINNILQKYLPPKK